MTAALPTHGVSAVKQRLLKNKTCRAKNAPSIIRVAGADHCRQQTEFSDFRPRNRCLVRCSVSGRVLFVHSRHIHSTRRSCFVFLCVTCFFDNNSVSSVPRSSLAFGRIFHFVITFWARVAHPWTHIFKCNIFSVNLK